MSASLQKATTPSAEAVIESALIEQTEIKRSRLAARSVLAYLDAFGYAVAPKQPTSPMLDSE